MAKLDPRTTLRDDIDRLGASRGASGEAATRHGVPPLAEQLGRVVESRPRPCLLVLGGLDMGQTIEIGEDGVVLGRDETCDLILRDDGISRRHLEVKPHGADRAIARDLASTNGTFVRGQRVEVAELQSGEKLLVGRRTLLRFALQDDLDLQYQREMYSSSIRDGLTGLFNRRYFGQKLRADISFSRRHRVPLSLLMFDIDHFKRVNDTHGHRTGDAVLTAFAATVADSIRTEDVLARYGGEEFAIIAPATGLDGARALAERIRETVALKTVESADGSGAGVGITVSAGVATLRPGQAIEADAMVDAADQNLYAAKKGGRNRIVASEIA